MIGKIQFGMEYNTVNSEFQLLEQTLLAGDIEHALAVAADFFLRQGDAHRLFEVRKMQARSKLGLPLIASLVSRQSDAPEPSPDGISAKQADLDRYLLKACRETAQIFLARGDILAAWAYLEPIEDRQWVREAIAQTPVTSDNLDSLVDCCFHRGAHPSFGFQLVLKHSGTCSAITLLDSAIPYLERGLRKQLTLILVDHFYQEWLQNLPSQFVECAQFSWLRGNHPEEMLHHLKNGIQWTIGGPHIDATHLHSITRLGQQLNDPASLLKLWVLSDYGQHLDPIFQFPGHPPMENHFADHRTFFAALCGHDVDRATHYFLAKWESASATPNQLIMAETLVDWLARIGNIEKSIDLAIRYPGDDFGRLGIAPNLLEVAANHPAASEKLANYFRDQGDMLSYLMTRLNKSEQ